MPDLADIFGLYGGAYLEKFAHRMPQSHKRTLFDILNCRNGTFGAHIDRCDRCGYTHLFYHSCSNRSCPKCHAGHTKKWIEKSKSILLPVHYFHVVFTLPAPLRPLVRAHPSILLNCLIKAAAYTLIKLMEKPRFGGGKPGMLSVLHTWTRTMLYHPHVHFLVAGGLISKDGSQWLGLRKKYLLPVSVMSKVFRARFMKLARKALADIKFPHSLWQKEWNVFSKPCVRGGSKVLQYLARYIHRIAITNNRILEHRNGMIKFKYQDSKTRQWKTTTITASEFIRRFLQHVLPKGFHKVRYHGFLAPKHRHLLLSLKLTLPDRSKQDEQNPLLNRCRKCPACRTGNMVVILHIFYKKHLPLIVRPPP